MLEIMVRSKAGATIPVMSSPFPRDITINATIPETINALTAIPEYFTNFKNVVESGFIEHAMGFIWGYQAYRNSGGKRITSSAAEGSATTAKPCTFERDLGSAPETGELRLTR
jgi:hypothetical protein